VAPRWRSKHRGADPFRAVEKSGLAARTTGAGLATMFSTGYGAPRGERGPAHAPNVSGHRATQSTDAEQNAHQSDMDPSDPTARYTRATSGTQSGV
jgi:hypothetical protein